MCKENTNTYKMHIASPLMIAKMPPSWLCVQSWNIDVKDYFAREPPWTKCQVPGVCFVHYFNVFVVSVDTFVLIPKLSLNELFGSPLHAFGLVHETRTFISLHWHHFVTSIIKLMNIVSICLCTILVKVFARAQTNPNKTTQGLGLKEGWASVYKD